MDDVNAARTNASMSRTDWDSTEREWDQIMVKTYGTLVSMLGMRNVGTECGDGDTGC